MAGPGGIIGKVCGSVIMKKNWYADLSRRERQIMDIVYQQGSASVNDVIEHMADPPSYSSVRALMNVLKDKKHLKTQVLQVIWEQIAKPRLANLE